MPDQLNARKAAEAVIEHIKRGMPGLDICLISQSGDCRDFNGCTDHAESVVAAIIARNLANLTLTELASLVEKREQWLQEEISAGRRLDCEGELGGDKGDRLAALEKELYEGSERLEELARQFDEE